MNNDALNQDARSQEQRYDPQVPDSRSTSLEPVVKDMPPPREGSKHTAKLASLSILFAIMVVFGSVAYVSNNRQTSSTRASSENLFGPASISSEEKALTSSVTEFPKTYKGRAIPESLFTEGNQKYIAIPAVERKAYIINRIVLYYIYDDVLTTNSIAHTKITPPVTFDGIEAAVPSLAATMKQQYPQSDIFVTQYLSRFAF